MLSSDAGTDVVRLKEVARVRESFVQACESGERPCIQQLLQAYAGEERAVLFRELFQLEVAHRQKCDETVSGTEYCRKFPEFTTWINDALAGLDATHSTANCEGDAVVTFRVIAGPHAGTELRAARREVVMVGRDSKAALRLNDDASVSQFHLRIEVCPPLCALFAISKTNPSFVNDRSVSEAVLTDGDLIRIGESVIQLIVHAGNKQLASAPISTVVVQRCTADNAGSTEETVPGYHLDERLGSGTMGVVYRARQIVGGRQVALKVMAPCARSDADAMRLFLREAATLHRLRHPGIVELLEFGVCEDHFFLAMEYVPTTTFAEVVQGRPEGTRLRIACAIVDHVLQALGHAHALGIVHRDIKPSNILLHRKADGLTVKVSDFGLAKDYVNAGFSGITEAGQTRGTLAFMAPEQILDCRFARPACDIYSAGATLYYYLSGQYPHDFSRRASPFTTILEDDPVPLQDRCRQAPETLSEVVHTALARTPTDRFSNTEAMRKSLAPFVSATTRVAR